MSKQIRKQHSSQFKFKVALAVLKGNKPAAAICQEFGVISSQIYLWKKLLEENGAEIFSSNKKTENHDSEIDKLHSIIGKLTVERDFLSRALGK